MSGQDIYHDTTMVQSELHRKPNRSREVLAWHRERAPVTPSSMIQFATAALSRYGSRRTVQLPVRDATVGWWG